MGFNPLTLGGSDKTRYFDVKPGLFFDNLNPGEEINTIQSNRPSQLLSEFRSAMLRAIAAGTRTSYSSIAKKLKPLCLLRVPMVAASEV